MNFPLELLIIAGLNIAGMVIMLLVLHGIKKNMAPADDRLGQSLQLAMKSLKDKSGKVQEVKIESVQSKKTTILSMDDPARFEVKRMHKDLIGFSLYVLADNGLNEFYLFLESDRGQLVGLGNLDDT